MSHYTVIKTSTGEVVFPRTKQPVRGALVRRAWQIEDKRRGLPVRRDNDWRRKRNKRSKDELITALCFLGAGLIVILSI